MAESAEILALVERGYLRVADMSAMFGVTQQACSHLTRGEDFPAPAKVIGTRRLSRRRDVERWRDAKPRVWTRSGGIRGRKFIPPRSRRFAPQSMPCQMNPSGRCPERSLRPWQGGEAGRHWGNSAFTGVDVHILIHGVTDVKEIWTFNLKAREAPSACCSEPLT